MCASFQQLRQQERRTSRDQCKSKLPQLQIMSCARDGVGSALDLDVYRVIDSYYSAGQIALLREGRKRYKTNSFDSILCGEGRLMDEQQLRALKPELDRFLDRYAPLFGRDETQAHARRC